MKDIITPIGSLALKPGTTIDISKNNPLFTRAEEFSINLSIPRKPNDRIFGYKTRLSAVGSIVPIPARFVFKGREKLSGSIQIVAGDDDNYEVILKGSRSDFMFQFGESKISEIDFGDQLFVPGVEFPSDGQITTEMTQTATQQRDWICFPVYHSGLNVWINRFSFDAGSFAWDTNGYRTVFVRLHRVIERLFALRGYSISENWFADTDERKKIVIFNNANNLGRIINIKNLLPDWTIMSFINEIEDFFPVTIFINSHTKSVKISGDDTIANSVAVDSLDRFALKGTKINFNSKQNGYDLTYTLPDDDDTTKTAWDYTDEAWAIEINTFNDLPASSYAGCSYLVLTEGRYYEAKYTDEVLSFEPTGSVVLGVRSGKKDIKRETKIFPLLSKTQIQVEMVTAVEEGSLDRRVSGHFSMLVPHTSKTAASWKKDFRPVTFRGIQAADIVPGHIPVGFDPIYVNYPMANYLNRKTDATRWPDNTLELRFDGEQGLRGAETIAFVNGAEKLEVKLIINHLDLENLDTSKIYTLNGRKVMISELTIHYAENSTVEVDAVLLAQGR